MVGQTSKKLTFAKRMTEFIGKKSNPGGNAKNNIEGFDCMGLIASYHWKYREGFPTEFKGLTYENYHELYLKDPKEAMKIVVEFFDSFCERIKFSEATVGDVILINSHYRDVPTIALYAGNAKIAIAIDNHFTTVIDIDILGDISIIWRL